MSIGSIPCIQAWAVRVLKASVISQATWAAAREVFSTDGHHRRPDHDARSGDPGRSTQPLHQRAPAAVEVAHTTCPQRLSQHVSCLLLEGVSVGCEPNERGEQTTCLCVRDRLREPVADTSVGIGQPRSGGQAHQRRKPPGNAAEVAAERRDEPPVEE